MDCSPAIADFASLFQLGAGVNFGVSFIYYLMDQEKGAYKNKLDSLRRSRSLLRPEQTDEYDSALRKIDRIGNMAAKKLLIPNRAALRALISCGLVCTALLMKIGFDPKSCQVVIIWIGIAFSILPVPLAYFAQHLIVKSFFKECWDEIRAVEKAYFP